MENTISMSINFKCFDNFLLSAKTFEKFLLLIFWKGITIFFQFISTM